MRVEMDPRGNLYSSRQDRVIIYKQKGLYFYEWPSENTESKGKDANTGQRGEQRKRGMSRSSARLRSSGGE
jgi:hypothetical protein